MRAQSDGNTKSSLAKVVLIVMVAVCAELISWLLLHASVTALIAIPIVFAGLMGLVLFNETDTKA